MLILFILSILFFRVVRVFRGSLSLEDTGDEAVADAIGVVRVACEPDREHTILHQRPPN